MSTSTVKRTKSLVDPEVQGGILRTVAIHWILFFVCNAVALMIWVRLFEQPDADWGQTFGDTLRRFLPFFVITAALIPAFVLDTLKMSNRFAGPVSRLRRALQDAREGRTVKPLKFRGRDYWQDMATDFNSLLERAQVGPVDSEQDDSDSESESANA